MFVWRIRANCSYGKHNKTLRIKSFGGTGSFHKAIKLCKLDKYDLNRQFLMISYVPILLAKIQDSYQLRNLIKCRLLVIDKRTNVKAISLHTI